MIFMGVDLLMNGAQSKRIICYSVKGSSLTVGFRYGAGEAEMLLERYGGNGLFDFRRLVSKQSGIVFESHSDWHGPFIVAAVNDPDGDHPALKYFTGGNHRTTNKADGGEATARCEDCVFFADGEHVNDTVGTAREMEIRWSNLVQGYNTSKENGKGRAILREDHRMRILNGAFFTHVELIALENLKIERWYGLQCVLDAYPVTAFRGAKNNRPFRNTEETEAFSGDLSGCEMTHGGGGHRMTVGLDSEYGLGKRDRPEVVSGTNGMFISGGKAYYSIVNGALPMRRGERYAVRGYYRFEPED